tara:strand:+ start:564 stop:1004 length:441 start_codon:yes stop_codon:yes gene_type:complete
MNKLPEDCLHYIYKFCFDEVLKELPKLKDIHIHEWSIWCPHFTINDLCSKPNMSYNFIFIEEKYVRKTKFDSRLHRYSTSCYEIKGEISYILQKIKELDKCASIYFRDHLNVPKVDNNNIILIQKFGANNWVDIIGVLCDWKQYLQ